MYLCLCVCLCVSVASEFVYSVCMYLKGSSIHVHVVSLLLTVWGGEGGGACGV